MSTLLTPEAARRTDSDVVLSARNVSVVYDGDRPTRAVRDVSLDLRRGEILGIAGESGCGKSTLAYALTRMLRAPARLDGGSLHFTGRDGATVDLTALDGAALRAFRWQRISMVFQSAMSSLNPVTSLARQFDDIFRTHLPDLPKEERRRRAGSCWPWSASTPVESAASRTSSPAACGNASASPWPSPSTPRS